MTRGVIAPSINCNVITHSEELNVYQPSDNFTSGFWEQVARGDHVGWPLVLREGRLEKGKAKLTWKWWQQSIKDRQSITLLLVTLKKLNKNIKTLCFGCTSVISDVFTLYKYANKLCDLFLSLYIFYIFNINFARWWSMWKTFWSILSLLKNI